MLWFALFVMLSFVWTDYTSKIQWANCLEKFADAQNYIKVNQPGSKCVSYEIATSYLKHYDLTHTPMGRFLRVGVSP
jgi:hypothetical protein